MQHTDWHAQRTSFGSAADLYDRVRPSYPAAAIEWMLGTEPRRVVDVGAGTGVLTRQLAAAGHDVVAVEPDEGMRARLVANQPGVAAPAGSAEAIPLPDASVDAVVAGQAYHWFDTAKAHPEIARVLRPGGVFAPVWNHRDDGEGWVAALSEIVGGEDVPAVELPTELFGPVETTRVRWQLDTGPDALVDLVRSRSYYLTATPELRAELEARIRELCATHPALRGRESFPLPYVTHAVRARRE